MIISLPPNFALEVLAGAAVFAALGLYQMLSGIGDFFEGKGAYQKALAEQIDQRTEEARAEAELEQEENDRIVELEDENSDLSGQVDELKNEIYGLQLKAKLRDLFESLEDQIFNRTAEPEAEAAPAVTEASPETPVATEATPIEAGTPAATEEPVAEVQVQTDAPATTEAPAAPVAEAEASA